MNPIPVEPAAPGTPPTNELTDHDMDVLMMKSDPETTTVAMIRDAQKRSGAATVRMVGTDKNDEPCIMIMFCDNSNGDLKRRLFGYEVVDKMLDAEGAGKDAADEDPDDDPDDK